MNDNHRNNFDFLRLFAASLVILSHSYPMRGQPDPLREVARFLSMGGVAVSIFFVISGFLVTKSMLESASVKEFAIKRVLRIYPAMIASVLFCMFIIGPAATVLPLGEYFRSPDLWRFLQTLTFTKFNATLPYVFYDFDYHTAHRVNTVYWTLTVEVMLYIATALLFRLRLLKYPPLLLIWAICAMTYLLAPHGKLLLLPYPEIFRCACLYFGGALLYCVKDRISYRNTPLFLTLLLFIGFSLAFGKGGQRALFFLALPYAVIYLAHLPSPLHHFGKYGDFSYGMYLFANPIQQSLVLFLGKEMSTPFYFSLCMAITLFFAVLSWYFVEAPALRWKKHFISGVSAKNHA